MKNYSNTTDKLMLLLISATSFLAGLVYYDYKILAITLFVFSVFFQLIREGKQSNIQGKGISKITVDVDPPSNPDKGDVWIDTK